MNGSRSRRSLAPAENADVFRNAGGDVGSAQSAPPRTMKRIAADAAASARSPAIPSSVRSSAMRGDVSSVLLGPRS